MKVRTAILFTGVAALCLAALVAFIPSSEDSASQTEAAEAPTECNSCTLRHQALSKPKDVREREGAELRRLFERSKSNSQQQ